MIVLACGLSQSGKTTLLKDAPLAELGFTHVRASTLLKQNGRPISQLRVNDVERNQLELATTLRGMLSVNRSYILLDGHLLIETNDGPQLVSDTSLKSLPLQGIIFAEEDADAVARRRQESESPLTHSREEIADLMHIEALHARRLARRFGIEIVTINARSTVSLMVALQKFIPREHPV